MNIDPIIQRLVEARRVDGRNLRQLSVDSGVNPATLSEAERGLHSTTLPKLRLWARALGYDIVLAPLAGPGSTSPEPEPPDQSMTLNTDKPGGGRPTAYPDGAAR